MSLRTVNYSAVNGNPTYGNTMLHENIFCKLSKHCYNTENIALRINTYIRQITNYKPRKHNIYNLYKIPN